MARKRIPKDIETALLALSRRRGCLCVAYNNDEATKLRGQIDHLDHNPTNNSLDNLAWLCLEQHDEYDGKTSQSKGITIDEVKTHREDLYQRVTTATVTVHSEDSSSFQEVHQPVTIVEFALGKLTKIIRENPRAKKMYSEAWISNSSQETTFLVLQFNNDWRAERYKVVLDDKQAIDNSRSISSMDSQESILLDFDIFQVGNVVTLAGRIIRSIAEKARGNDFLVEYHAQSGQIESLSFVLLSLGEDAMAVGSKFYIQIYE